MGADDVWVAGVGRVDRGPILVPQIDRVAAAPVIAASPRSDTETARQRLDERLARGHIDTAQYQSRVAALHEHTPAP